MLIPQLHAVHLNIRAKCQLQIYKGLIISAIRTDCTLGFEPILSNRLNSSQSPT